MVLEDVEDCLEAAMAELMRTNPADLVVLGERLRDCPEVEGASVDQRVPELMLAPVVAEDRESEVYPVPALVEARPMSVRVAHLVQALV